MRLKAEYGNIEATREELAKLFTQTDKELGAGIEALLRNDLEQAQIIVSKPKTEPKPNFKELIRDL